MSGYGDGNHALAMDQLKNIIDATIVPCTSCHAAKGEECRRPYGARYRFHASRKDAALFAYTMGRRLSQ
jgi:hypothetical protein